MRRGTRVLIVVIVAIGTNVGLHAAFGWSGHGCWKHHHGYYRHHNGCDNNYQHDHHGYNNTIADPWNCTPANSSTNDVRDTLLPK